MNKGHSLPFPTLRIFFPVLQSEGTDKATFPVALGLFVCQKSVQRSPRSKTCSGASGRHGLLLLLFHCCFHPEDGRDSLTIDNTKILSFNNSYFKIISDYCIKIEKISALWSKFLNSEAACTPSP